MSYQIPGSSAGRAGGCEKQLPREIVVEKSGEFREACPPLDVENGNPEPSPEMSLFREGAETRASARTPGNPGGSARHPQPKYLGRVMR